MEQDMGSTDTITADSEKLDSQQIRHSSPGLEHSGTPSHAVSAETLNVGGVHKTQGMRLKA